MSKKRSSQDFEAKVSLITEKAETNLAVGSFRVDVDSNNSLFQVLKNPNTGEFMIHGENDRLEYEGMVEAEDNKYVLGYYDSETKKLRIQPVPVVSMSTVVKSKKRTSGPSIKQANVRYANQRTALGESFGTKKAKKALNDLERNKLDAEQLQDFEAAIVDSVQTAAATLPTAQEREKTLSSERPIPPYNLSATRVEDIYPFIDGIVTVQEHESIKQVINSVSLDDSTLDDILTVFPVGTPAFIRNRIQQLLQLSSKNQIKQKLIELYYASLLSTFYANRRVSNKTALSAKMGTYVPSTLITGLLNKFTVSKAGAFGKHKDKNFAIDPNSENKILCHLLALMLHINGYSVAVPPLSQELSIKPSKISDLFRALGCVIKLPTTGQAEGLGISKSDMLTYKIASLSAPLRLPEVVKRNRSSGR